MHESNAPERDIRKPAVEDDEENEHINRGSYAGPLGQVETDLPIETDGAEVSGTTQAGEVEGRKPVGGAS